MAAQARPVGRASAIADTADGLPTLLVRPRLLAGESLPSWLTRVARANGREHARDLLPLVAAPIGTSSSREDATELPVSGHTFIRLSALTRTPIADIYAASYHAFAALLRGTKEPSAVLRLPDGAVSPLLMAGEGLHLLRPASAAQYCPLCLRDAAYHRLLWGAIPVAACLRHHCLLVDSCPSCGAPVPIQAIVADRCTACAADLASAVPVVLPDDPFTHLSQATLQRWLLGDPEPPLGLDEQHLPQADPASLFAVIHGVHHVMRTTGLGLPPRLYSGERPARQVRRRLHPTEVLQLYVAAFRTLLAWPHGWYAFLDALVERSTGQVGAGRGGHALGWFFGYWIQRIWRGQAFLWLQEAIDEYLLMRYGKDNTFSRTARARGESLAERREYLDLNAAAELLGCPRSLLARLVETGWLTAQEAADRRGELPLTIIARADVLTLREQYRRWIRRPEAARMLGISEGLLDSLTARTLIPVVMHSQEGGTTACWYFDRAALAAWQEGLATHAEPLPVGYAADAVAAARGDFLPLWRAARVVYTLGWTAADLVAGVGAGTIGVYRGATASSSLGELLFSREELRGLVAATRSTEGWLSGTEATAWLGCANDTFAALVAAGTLVPIATRGKTRYFTRASLERFSEEAATSRTARAQARGLSCEEAAALLGTTLNSVLKWAAAGRLPTLPPAAGDRAHWRFDPGALRVWRAAHLTLGEATTLLGLPPEFVRAEMRAGRLVAPFGGRRTPWFTREAIEQLRARLSSAASVER